MFLYSMYFLKIFEQKITINCLQMAEGEAEYYGG